MDLLRASDIANDLLDEEAAGRLGVNRTDHRVLDVLGREGPLSAGRLAERNRLSRPAMTTVIDRLELAGYARRVPDPDDRRRVMVEATPRVMRRALEIYGPIAELARSRFKRYNRAELELLERFLAEAIELTETELARLSK